jgi:hypothetical protein
MRTTALEEIGKELNIKRKTWRELTSCEDSVSPALGPLYITVNTSIIHKLSFAVFLSTAK